MLESGGWPTSIPSLTNAGEFFPASRNLGLHLHGQPRGDAVGTPGGFADVGRAGQLFYWIDRKNGVGGYWASQILPFQDIASYTGFVDFETAVYRALKR